MKKHLKVLPLLLILLFGLSNFAVATPKDDKLPPKKVLKGFLKESNAVILIEVESVSQKDDGGYSVVTVEGVVLKRYKGALKKNQRITYTTFAETGLANIEKGSRIAFLTMKKAVDGKKSWRTIENGDFVFSEALEKRLKSASATNE